MSIDISESDRKDYDELECKNITLDMFVLHRIKESVNAGSIAARYKGLRRGVRGFNSVSSLSFNRNDAVARTIVIDGANVMHCGSPHVDGREGSSQSIPDVSALLSVMRFFIVRGFEVFAVISRKYAKHGATNFKEGIDQLVNNNLCVIVPHTNLDDSVALEFAAQINGVVVSSDLYRDHAAECDRMRRIVEENRLGIEWENIKENNKNTRGTNREHDYLPSKQFVFKTDNGAIMSEEDVIKRVYAFQEQLQYGISKERRDLAQPDKKKQKMLTIIEELIVTGLQKYLENVNAIRETPVHVPNESRSSDPDSEDSFIQEVPPDEQAAYISDHSMEAEW